MRLLLTLLRGVIWALGVGALISLALGEYLWLLACIVVEAAALLGYACVIVSRDDPERSEP